MHKYLVIYEEAVSHHIWLCNRSRPDVLIYEENFIFFFISAWTLPQVLRDRGFLPPGLRADPAAAGLGPPRLRRSHRRDEDRSGKPVLQSTQVIALDSECFIHSLW
jgi:hypothetical protein